jgi:hypothetical protein
MPGIVQNKDYAQWLTLRVGQLNSSSGALSELFPEGTAIRVRNCLEHVMTTSNSVDRPHYGSTGSYKRLSAMDEVECSRFPMRSHDVRCLIERVFGEPFLGDSTCVCF